MEYFSHDYNTRVDTKIVSLMRKHKLEGYGLYWCIVEDLYNNANALPMDCDGIAYDYRCDVQLVKSVLNDFGLFEIIDGVISSHSVEKRLQERDKRSFSAKKSAESRWKNKNVQKTQDIHNEVVVKYIEPEEMPKQYERNAFALQSEYERNAIKEKESKVKKSKIKKREETKKFVSPSLIEFENYFEENGYQKEVAERAWTGYSVAEWHDSTGKKVLNWKQKCQNVWFRPENKIISKNEVQKINPQHDFSMKISGIENTFLTRCEGYRHNYGKEPPQEWFDKFNEANGTNLQPKKEPISA